MMTPQRLLCLTLLLACQRPRAAETEASPRPPQPAPAVAASPKAATQAAASAAAAPSPAAHAGGLSWHDSPPLVSRPPKSSMRAAEYGVAGDERAELTVFYFGPDEGGSVEANMTRWLGQFRQTDGSDSASKAKRGTRTVGGISVALLEVDGNYAGGMAPPGAPPPEPQQDAMLLGAVTSGPRGPVFFKLVGPRATVERSRTAFDQMIGSLTQP